jgi:hypothetical protein
MDGFGARSILGSISIMAGGRGRMGQAYVAVGKWFAGSKGLTA